MMRKKTKWMIIEHIIAASSHGISYPQPSWPVRPDP
jgi:hypothetical protein